MTKKELYISNPEAAKELGCSPQKMKALIYSGICPVGVVIEDGRRKNDRIIIGRENFEKWRRGRSYEQIIEDNKAPADCRLDMDYLRNASLQEMVSILAENENFKLMMQTLSIVSKGV